MIASVRLSFVAIGFIALAGVTSVSAAEGTRGTVRGGQLTRSFSGEGPVYSGQTTRVGPNGGTYTSNSKCLDGVVDRCRRSYAATGPNGKTYTGERATARGPFGVRSIGAVSGPRGNVAVGAHRRWR